MKYIYDIYQFYLLAIAAWQSNNLLNIIMLSSQQLSQLATHHHNLYADWVHKEKKMNPSTQPHSPANRHTISYWNRASKGSRGSSARKRRPIFDENSKMRNTFDVNEDTEYLSAKNLNQPSEQIHIHRKSESIENKKAIKQFAMQYQKKEYNVGLGLMNPAQLAVMVDRLRIKQFSNNAKY